MGRGCNNVCIKMGITYKTIWPELPHVKVPVLHKVVYAEAVDGVPAKYQRSYKDHLVDTLCNEPPCI